MKKLLLLNGLAILAVVANHASHKGFVAMFWWTDRYRPVAVPNYDQLGSLSYYGLVAGQKLAVFSIASFLFITAIFIVYAMRGSQKILKWSIVSRRIFNLLPPYLIWSLVYFAAQYLIDIRYSPQEYLLRLLDLKPNAYFYIPMVVLFYLVSPLVAPLARDKWKLLLSVSLLIHALVIARSYLSVYIHVVEPGNQSLLLMKSYIPASHFFEYQFYFILGLVCGFHFSRLQAWVSRYRWILLVLLLISATLAMVEAELITRAMDDVIWRSVTLSLPATLYAVSFIFCFLAFAKPTFLFSDALYRIGSASLGIYLIHVPILLYLPKIIYHLAPAIMAYQVVYQTVLITVAVGGPMLLMALVRKSPMRKAYRYLFG